MTERQAAADFRHFNPLQTVKEVILPVFDLQVGGKEMKQIKDQTNKPKHGEEHQLKPDQQHLPDARTLLSGADRHRDTQQPRDIGRDMGSDPERMKSVERNSAIVRKLFPKVDVDDFNNPRNAAYRYLMHHECVDNYSSTQANDRAILEKASPGITKQLDAIVAAQKKVGVPGSHC